MFTDRDAEINLWSLRRSGAIGLGSFSVAQSQHA
jgi:hypothetical protein